MASIEPIELKTGQNENAVLEEEENATDRKNEASVDGCCCRRRDGILLAIVVIAVILIVTIILGIVFGVVVKKDGTNTTTSDGQHVFGIDEMENSTRSIEQYYKVDIGWQAQTYNGWTFGFPTYQTDAIVEDGGEAWDDNHEFKVKLDIRDDGRTAIVKSEVHQLCCAHELEADPNLVVDSGSWGGWGEIMNCRCKQLWYDHQIRAKVSKVGQSDVGGEMITRNAQDDEQIDNIPEADDTSDSSP